jgi:hypothetical protein
VTHREPTRRGCSYEDVRWQKSVRRIARRDARRAARRVGDAALAEEDSARRADARDGDSEARTVRVVAPGFEKRRQARPGARGNPVGRGTTEGVPIVARIVPQGTARWRSWSRGSSAECTARCIPVSFRPVLGTGAAVAVRRHGASEIGDGHGAGCSSRRGAGGPSHEAPRGAGPRSATAGLRDRCASRGRGRVSRSSGRSKLAGANS